MGNVRLYLVTLKPQYNNPINKEFDFKSLINLGFNDAAAMLGLLRMFCLVCSVLVLFCLFCLVLYGCSVLRVLAQFSSKGISEHLFSPRNLSPGPTQLKRKAFRMSFVDIETFKQKIIIPQKNWRRKRAEKQR
jgi:hypothetical protein